MSENASGVYEINLCCPECGGHQWVPNADGTWECIVCGCDCTTEEMTSLSYET